MRVLLLDGAANTLAGTEDLLDGARKSATERLVAHRPRDVDNLVKRDVAAVNDVLGLLTVTRGLCSVSQDDRTRYIPLRALMTSEEAEGTTATWA